MEQFLHNFLAFPVIIFSGMLVIVALYWLIASFGLLDIDMLDIDSPDAGGDIGDLGGDPGGDPGDGDVTDGVAHGGFAGILLKLGLTGIPLTVVLTFVTIFGWFISYFGVHFALRFLDGGPERYALGLLLFVAAFVIGIFLTNIVVRPLRPLFRKHEALTSQSLRGQTVTARSTVTPKRGEAVYQDGGAGLLLQVRSLPDGPSFSRGDKVVILEYHPDSHTYTVIAEEEFKGQ